MLSSMCQVCEFCLQIYVEKHAREKKGEWVSGNLVFFRMHRISDIYFVGGFGTVQWVDVADYMATKPDSIVAADPQQTISVSHKTHSCVAFLTLPNFWIWTEEVHVVHRHNSHHIKHTVTL